MFGGAALGAGIQATDSAISGGVAIKESNKAWQRQKTVLQKGIRWRVADLRAAGLNPILAATGAGFGGGGAPSVATARIPGGKAAEAVSSGARSFAKAKADTKLANLIQQQVRESKAREHEVYTKAETNMQEKYRIFEARRLLELQRERLSFDLPKAMREAELWSGKSGEAMKAKEAARGISIFGTGIR